MGLDLGSKKGCCLLLDVESGDAVNTCRPWQHRMTAGFGYDLDTVEVWRFFGEATCEAMAKVGARPQDVLAVSTTGMRHGSVVVDAKGEVLLATPTRDGRGALQGLQLAGERGREFHERTGHFPRALVHGFAPIVDGGLSARASRPGTRGVGTERLVGVSAVGKDGR